VLVSYIGALNMFSAFKACRSSIDLIVQCLSYITVFALIIMYFLFSFSLFFYFTNPKETLADEDVSTSIWFQFRQVLPMMFTGAAW
jgi:hypothetical protein